MASLDEAREIGDVEVGIIGGTGFSGVGGSEGIGSVCGCDDVSGFEGVIGSGVNVIGGGRSIVVLGSI